MGACLQPAAAAMQGLRRPAASEIARQPHRTNFRRTAQVGSVISCACGNFDAPYHSAGPCCLAGPNPDRPSLCSRAGGQTGRPGHYWNHLSVPAEYERPRSKRGRRAGWLRRGATHDQPHRWRQTERLSSSCTEQPRQWGRCSLTRLRPDKPHGLLRWFVRPNSGMRSRYSASPPRRTRTRIRRGR